MEAAGTLARSTQPLAAKSGGGSAAERSHPRTKRPRPRPPKASPPRLYTKTSRPEPEPDGGVVCVCVCVCVRARARAYEIVLFGWGEERTLLLGPDSFPVMARGTKMSPPGTPRIRHPGDLKGGLRQVPPQMAIMRGRGELSAGGPERGPPRTRRTGGYPPRPLRPPQTHRRRLGAPSNSPF